MDPQTHAKKVHYILDADSIVLHPYRKSYVKEYH